jgi:nucleotide-binding universal stress UspA family protein
MRTRVVVGINDGDYASPLWWAIHAFSLDATSLELIHCVTGRLSTEMPYSNDDVIAAGRQIVEQAVAFSRDLGASVVAEVREGFAGEILVACSKDADHLVIGSSRVRHMFQAPGMSVVTHCVRHAICPLTIVPPRDTAKEFDGVFRRT